MGGLSKKAYQLKKIRAEHKLPSLTVDAGNLLFKSQFVAPALLQQTAISAEGIVDAYNLMGYDAVGVGENDLAAGVAFLEKQAARSQFTWLSANLVRKSDRQPVFSASLLRRVGDITIGIIGLTGPDRKTGSADSDGVVILPWQEVLPEMVPELSDRCDLLILLSNDSTEQNTEIANTFAGIHLIIQASPRRGNSDPKLLNNSLLTQTGKEGKYLGKMLVDWRKSKTWGRRGATKELALKKQELDGLNSRINRMAQRDSEKELAASSSYQNLLRTRERLLAVIGFLEKELTDLDKTGSVPSTHENTFLTLEENLPDQPEVEKIVKKIKQDINLAGRTRVAETTGMSGKTAAILENLPFTGWQVCAECHRQQADFWEKTGHSSAYQPLVDEEQQFNLDCIVCHVTAEYGTTKISGNDADLLALPVELRQVGCEVCHGPGKSHAPSRDAAAISRRPAENVCRRCHTPERDEEFNYANDLIRIACPANR